ncbi:dual specificity protein kinase CLK1-like isoform X2 [Antennarius striatus]|uniref:dual specificity protein kinase CLK1-like isoform X2 n=1 Tax=Antennarius striatus TaxID=241820 RepID=UPI0035B0E5C3
MGMKDGRGAWRDDESKADSCADRSYNGRSSCSSQTISNVPSRPDDNSPPPLCAFIGDNAVNADDDGVKRSQEDRSCGNDDKNHLDYHIGLVMKERYEVVSTLGEGAYGKVVECIDREKNRRVAVKIAMNTDCFREVARSEIKVLEEINRLDDDNIFACVRMLDWFEYRGHVCIVLELLGISTFEFLQRNKSLTFSVDQIRHMAFQIFKAVCFLHRNNLTHTDLKPENILFVGSTYDLVCDDKTQCDVKVVDFGTATFDHQDHQSLVSTRHYRAPEIILDLGWSHSCDVWSLGCVLMEFYLGRILFMTHDSKEHLAMMEKVLGPIPPHLLKQTRKKHYVLNERLDWDERSPAAERIRKHCQPLKQFMLRRTEDERQLFDLLGCMLEFDVCRRITLEEALWHPFFSPLRTQKKKQHRS